MNAFIRLEAVQILSVFWHSWWFQICARRTRPPPWCFVNLSAVTRASKAWSCSPQQCFRVAWFSFRVVKRIARSLNLGWWWWSSSHVMDQECPRVHQEDSWGELRLCLLAARWNPCCLHAGALLQWFIQERQLSIWRWAMNCIQDWQLQLNSSQESNLMCPEFSKSGSCRSYLRVSAPELGSARLTMDHHWHLARYHFLESFMSHQLAKLQGYWVDHRVDHRRWSCTRLRF